MNSVTNDSIFAFVVFYFLLIYFIPPLPPNYITAPITLSLLIIQVILYMYLYKILLSILRVIHVGIYI